MRHAIDSCIPREARLKTSLWRFAWKIAVLILISIFPCALSSETKTKKGKATHAAQGSAAEGKKVFQSYCAMCHLPDDTKAKFGPGLKGVFKNKELPASHKPVTDANVREQIEKGSPEAKPMPMPAFSEKLSSEEIQNLLAYLKTL